MTAASVWFSSSASFSPQPSGLGYVFEVGKTNPKRAWKFEKMAGNDPYVANSENEITVPLCTKSGAMLRHGLFEFGYALNFHRFKCQPFKDWIFILSFRYVCMEDSVRVGKEEVVWINHGRGAVCASDWICWPWNTCHELLKRSSDFGTKRDSASRIGKLGAPWGGNVIEWRKRDAVGKERLRGLPENVEFEAEEDSGWKSVDIIE